MEKEIMKLNEEKIGYALKEGIKLHLSLCNKTFRNGFVREIRNGYCIFDDCINGEEPIFFLEVYKVEPFLKEAEPFLKKWVEEELKNDKKE